MNDPGLALRDDLLQILFSRPGLVEAFAGAGQRLTEVTGNWLRERYGEREQLAAAYHFLGGDAPVDEGIAAELIGLRESRVNNWLAGRAGPP